MLKFSFEISRRSKSFYTRKKENNEIQITFNLNIMKKKIQYLFETFQRFNIKMEKKYILSSSQ